MVAPLSVVVAVVVLIVVLVGSEQYRASRSKHCETLHAKEFKRVGSPVSSEINPNSTPACAQQVS